MGLCSNCTSRILSAQLPPAISDAQPPRWLPTPSTSEGVYDVWIVKAADYDAFQKQYGYRPPSMVSVLGVTFLRSDDTVLREDYWPRSCRPGAAPGGEGYLASNQLPYLFSNSLQEGIFLHECLGHGVHGSNHEDDPNYPKPGQAVGPTGWKHNVPEPDPTMHQPENLPQEARLGLLVEFASRYPTIHVHAWVPGVNILADNDS